MQDNHTGNTVFDIPTLIEFITAIDHPRAGRHHLDGHAVGVGVFREPPVFLEPGDRMRVEIEGIGRVENPVVDATEID